MILTFVIFISTALRWDNKHLSPTESSSLLVEGVNSNGETSVISEELLSQQHLLINNYHENKIGAPDPRI